MKGAMEVYEFGKVWRDTSNFSVLAKGNFLFNANIVYTSEGRGIEKESCTVMMIRHGRQDGEINIYENDILTAETHHLGLNHKFQDYKFNKKDASFIIKGTSEKMGGDYSIKITPNGLVAHFS
ncbi:hypothetical protein VRC24_19560 [Pseudomonas poae]|uniref:hypothetical protein n=1 Tax=Pseudomonas poae TaxID=200451 RepID=UPI0030CB8C53